MNNQNSVKFQKIRRNQKAVSALGLKTQRVTRGHNKETGTCYEHVPAYEYKFLRRNSVSVCNFNTAEQVPQISSPVSTLLKMGGAAWHDRQK